MSSETLKFNWSCNHTWKKSAKNTAWCVLGCSIGDFGTILYFQLTQISKVFQEVDLELLEHPGARYSAVFFYLRVL